jgi:hypothetical protein
MNEAAGRPAEERVELPSTRRRQAQRFIPAMPLSWFQRACRLPGKAPLVAVLLWYRSRLERSATVTLSQAFLGQFGVSRQAKYRALESLEAAGLVALRRRSHKNPEVTLLPQ